MANKDDSFFISQMKRRFFHIANENKKSFSYGKWREKFCNDSDERRFLLSQGRKDFF